MNKRKSHAFRKDIYLLGKNEDGELLWLESPSWDCGWYWGFGYIKTYTNNRHPYYLARDISSHSHFSGLIGQQDNGKYIYHINESLPETVLTEKEAWQLSELMKRFYTLRESAEIFGRGNANIVSTTAHDSTNKDIAKYINEVELPAIFDAVIALLTP